MTTRISNPYQERRQNSDRGRNKSRHSSHAISRRSRKKQHQSSSWQTWLYAHFYSSALQRRRTHSLFTVLAYFMIIAVLFSGALLLPSHAATVTAVTVAKPIARGQIITAQDLEEIHLPSGFHTISIASSKQSVVGKKSAIDLAKGSFIPLTATSDMPAIPKNYTIIDVHLTSSASALSPGERVSLVTSQDSPSVTNQTDTHEDNQEGKSDETSPDEIILSRNAIVTQKQTAAKTHQFWEADSDNKTTALAMAMPPADAINVLGAQDKSPIIAVTLR